MVNTHLEAFSDDGTKRKQIDQFHDHLAGLSKDGATWVAGGDLNSVPGGTEVLQEFADVVKKRGRDKAFEIYRQSGKAEKTEEK